MNTLQDQDLLPVGMLSEQRQQHASPGRFKMLIAYDQLDNGINGKKTCERLLRRVREREPDFEAEISVMKLTLLGDPEMNEEWLKAAMEADLIVLSVQYEAPLPFTVKNWISNWLERRRNTLQAIVAVLNRRPTDFPEVSPVQRYLREFVRNNNVALYMHFEDIPETAEIETAKTETVEAGTVEQQISVEQIQSRASCITSTLKESMRLRTSWRDLAA